MESLRALQRKMLAAIVHNKSEAIAGHLAMDKSQLEARLNIHRRNYQKLMGEVLAHAYPLVLSLFRCRYRDEPRFYRLALTYLRENPPAGPLLADYGGGFADFLAASSEPERQPLSRLARLEWQAAQIRRLPSEPSLTPQLLKGLTPPQLAELKPSLHDWVKLFREDYDFFGIWRAHRDKKPPPPFVGDEKPYYLVLSKDEEGVFLYRPDRPTWRLTKALQEGDSLGEAAAVVGSAVRLRKAFAFLLAEGFLRCD